MLRLDLACIWRPQWLELDLVMQEYIFVMACLIPYQAMCDHSSLKDTGKICVEWGEYSRIHKVLKCIKILIYSTSFPPCSHNWKWNTSLTTFHVEAYVVNSKHYESFLQHPLSMFERSSERTWKVKHQQDHELPGYISSCTSWGEEDIVQLWVREQWCRNGTL